MPLAQRGVVFEDRRTTVRAHPNRSDIACFVGYVAIRPDIAAGALPAAVERDLRESGWIGSAYARAGASRLLDVPVNISSWELFDRLFAWDRREVPGSSEKAATWMGSAVRSFFAEGGRQCVVIRVGDPVALGRELNEREVSAAIATLVPGYPFLLEASAADRKMWSGLGHLAGLEGVSFVVFPDLPELCSDPPGDAAPKQVRLETREQFVECAAEAGEPKLPRVTGYPSPRSDRKGYARWSLALSFVIRYLSRIRRDVQLVAAIPRPLASARIGNLFEFLAGNRGLGALAGSPDLMRDGIGSVFLQLAYPWIRTVWSNDLPENLETPEGALLGQLAVNSLTQGTYRSAARLKPRTIVDLAPALSRDERLGLLNGLAFQDRVSVYGFAPSGIRLLSDNTAALDANYRPASVNRLVSVLVRAARQAGDEALFENSGEDLWAEMEERVAGLLRRLYDLGALRGDAPDDAFSVRCDRSTMSQNDIDNGRVIVEVEFQAALPIERITVVLAYQDGAQITALREGSAA